MKHIIFTLADTQVISGFAILISGYASLHCGLQAYHWQIIVYLAWFSSMTHLASLTILRQRLHDWHGMRLWRLLAMSVLAVMLIVALVSTANFDWMVNADWDYNVGPEEYAICYFKDLRSRDDATYYSMVVSVVVVFTSFIARVIKLYRGLSTWPNRIRGSLSRGAFRVFLFLDTWSSSRSQSFSQDIKPYQRVLGSLVNTLVYQPGYSLFILLRLCLDMYNSLFWEVTIPYRFIRRTLTTLIA